MPPRTFKEIYRALSLIYLALILAPVTFVGVVYYEAWSGIIDPKTSEVPEIFPYVSYALAPLGVGLGYFMYKNLLSQIQPGLSLREKLGKLQGAILIRAALVEVPGYFASIVAMLSGQIPYLYITLLMVAILIFWRPTPESIRNDLQLSDAEAAKLSDPNEVID